MAHHPRRALLLAYTALATLQQYRCNAFSSFPSSQFARPSDTVRISSKLQPIIPTSPSATNFLRSTNGLSGKATDEEEDRSRPSIVRIKSHEDYVKFLEEDDRLCVVKFYANWCKSCQRFGVKYRHLAFEEGDHIAIEGTTVHSGKVRFAEVEYTASAKLCKALKVKKLPTVHMYRRGVGKIVDMTCKPSLFHLVVDELHRVVDGGECLGTTSIPETANAKSGIEVENIGVPTTSSNATSAASFDRAMTAGSKMADNLLTAVGKDKVRDGQKEEDKTPWFPFRF